jgi:phosphate starvation-inducible protein PhoH
MLKICFVLIFLYLVELNYSLVKNNLFTNKLLNKNFIFEVKKSKNLIYTDLYIDKSQNKYIGKNKNQNEYVKILNDDKVKLIFSIGPAGTGKTLLAYQQAINEFKNNNINKIVITRPVVCVDEEICFLPGNILKKMEP